MKINISVLLKNKSNNQGNKMKKIYKLLYIFIITSVCCYVIELFWSLITKGILINHSAVVIGPFNFAYGICGVALTLLLYKFKDESYIKIFLLSLLAVLS